MGRQSVRNFLRAFTDIQLDDQERGPDVSEDIQLGYLVDDIRETTYTYAGGGALEAGVAGQHGILSLECRTRRGLLIDQISMQQPSPSTDAVIHVWSSATQPTIVGGAGVTASLRGGGGIAGAGLAPEAALTTGTILTANIAVGNLRILNTDAMAWRPFHIRNTFHFNIVFDLVNTAVEMGIRWRELRLFP